MVTFGNVHNGSSAPLLNDLNFDDGQQFGPAVSELGVSETSRSNVRVQTLNDMPEDQPVHQVIKGILTAGQPAVMFGRSLAAKSFVMADISRCITTGAAWFNRRVIEGSVLYVPFEGQATFPNRMRAIAKQLPQDQYEKFASRFGMLRDPLPLTPGGGVEAAVSDVVANVSALEKRSGVCCCMIQLDTLFASLPGASLNDDKVMTHVLTLANRLGKETGAVPLFAHHPGHSDQHRMYGSSAGIGGFNSIICVDRVSGSAEEVGIAPEEERVIRLDKWKDGRCGHDVIIGRFNLEVIELGHDDDGEPITSCVINPLEAGGQPPSNKKQRKRPTGQAATALDRLGRMYDRSEDRRVLGREIGIPDADPTERWRVVPIDDWQEVCRKTELAIRKDGERERSKDKRENEAFWRAVNKLDQEFKLIGAYSTASGHAFRGIRPRVRMIV